MKVYIKFISLGTLNVFNIFTFSVVPPVLFSSFLPQQPQPSSAPPPVTSVTPPFSSPSLHALVSLSPPPLGSEPKAHVAVRRMCSMWLYLRMIINNLKHTHIFCDIHKVCTNIIGDIRPAMNFSVIMKKIISYLLNVFLTKLEDLISIKSVEQSKTTVFTLLL